MALGEAFVNIRADLRPFSKDLDKGLKSIVEKFEKAINAQLGRRMGKSLSAGLSDEVSKGAKLIAADLKDEIGKGAAQASEGAGRTSGRRFRKGFQEENKNFLTITRDLLADLTSALEDGFSALPAEAKAAVGAVIASVIVPAGAFITATLTAAIVAGVAGIGTAVAFQFQQVRNEGEGLLAFLRDGLLDAGRSFGQPVLDAMAVIRREFTRIQPLIASIFASVSGFVVPFTQILAEFTTIVLSGLDQGLKNLDLQGFLTSMRDGFRSLGVSIQKAFLILLSNRQVAESLTDLLGIIGGLIEAGAHLLSILTNLWIAFKRTVGIAVDLIFLFSRLVSVSDKTGDSLSTLINDLRNAFNPQRSKDIQQITGDAKALGPAFDGVAAATKGQETAAKEAAAAQKELNRMIQETIDIQFGVIDSTIAYETSLDRLQEDLKRVTKGERDLNLSEKDGRKLAEDFSGALRNLAQSIKDRVATGKIASKDAQGYYTAEAGKLRDLAIKAGISATKFDELYAAIIQLQTAQFEPKTGWLDTLRAAAKKLADELARAQRNKNLILSHGSKGRGGFFEGVDSNANGGRYTAPALTTVAEGYAPEVILPENKPLRSAQLLANSGLAGLMSGGVTTVIAYFDGEPFQARIVRTAKGVSNAQARQLTQRPRTV